MRILHVVHQYPPDHVGGTELYTQTVARRQAAQGHETAVFTPTPHPLTPHPLTPSPPLPTPENGVRVYRIPTGGRGRGRVFLDSFRQPRLLAALRAVLAAERPHLVHLQHLMGLPFAVAGAIRAAGIPFVVTLHDYWYGCANAQLITNDTQEICAGPDARFHNCGRCALARAGLPGQTWLAPAVAPLLQQRHRQTNHVLRSAAAVIAPTRFIRDTYRQMGLPADRIVVIPHGIEPPSDAAALRARAAARPPDAPLHLGYVGSLGWQKGLHVLVEAVNPLPPDRVRLSLYGGLDAFPDYVAGLQRQAAHPGIRFMGRIPRAALWAALADLDLLVVPTLWYEAFSLVVDEAFAVGVPVLASDIGVMPERIRHGQDGLLFPPGDAAALRAILQRLLANPAELAALRAHIRPVRTLAEHLADLDAVYSRLQ